MIDIGFSSIRYGLACMVLMLLAINSHAQSEIPMGTWRGHFPYSRINHVAVTAQVVYGASDNGVVVIDRTDGNNLSTLTKLNGLSSAGITALGAEPTSGKLIIAYDNGTFDFVSGSTVTPFNPFQNSSLAGARIIHNVSIMGSTAYLSADYGVLLFDLNRAAIQETWRDLGSSGETLKIYQSVFRGDSVFLATESGVIAGNLRDNLLDYRFWKRYTTGDMAAAIQAIAAFQDKVYVAINNQGIYEHGSGTWIKTSVLQGSAFTTLSASATALYVATTNGLFNMNSSGTVTSITDALLTTPLAVAEDTDGKLWIGDAQRGFISNAGGSFAVYRPNSPDGLATGRLRYAGGKIYLLGGGYTTAFTALGEAGNINVFDKGSWQTQQSSIPNLTDVAVVGDKQYVSSFGSGVEARTASGTTVYTENNSTLVNVSVPGNGVNTTGVIASADDGLWVLNYGTPQSLHLLKTDGNWQAFSFPYSASRYPTTIIADPYGYVWIALNPTQGGGMLAFNRSANKYHYITNVPGAGELPSTAVRSIAVDREGLVWVGTDQGIGYFFDPTDDIIRPIYENRFLLRDDKITAIAVDGGNRKWIGTERGVWLFNATGETLVHNFTLANSPLPSNRIHDIAIHGETGEVFFSTDHGVVSFRADATDSEDNFSAIKIFPNPVTARFTGMVGISGLATDAIVKITDVSGALVWQTQANGGAASWDVRDYRGRRATTGVYLVFAATPDGSERVVGKIAVID